MESQLEGLRNTYDILVEELKDRDRLGSLCIPRRS
jgi:hypothetical protein